MNRTQSRDAEMRQPRVADAVAPGVCLTRSRSFGTLTKKLRFPKQVPFFEVINHGPAPGFEKSVPIQPTKVCATVPHE